DMLQTRLAMLTTSNLDGGLSWLRRSLAHTRNWIFLSLQRRSGNAIHFPKGTGLGMLEREAVSVGIILHCISCSPPGGSGVARVSARISVPTSCDSKDSFPLLRCPRHVAVGVGGIHGGGTGYLDIIGSTPRGFREKNIWRSGARVLSSQF